MNEFFQKITKGKKISPKLKYFGLGLCIVGLVIFMVMKMGLGISDMVCVVVLSLSVVVGLFLYWFLDRMAMTESISLEENVKSYLEACASSLKAGNDIEKTLECAKEEVSDSKTAETIEMYLKDGTGPLVNSKYKSCLDALKDEPKDSTSLALSSFIDESIVEKKQKGKNVIGLVGLATVMIELVLYVVVVFMNNAGKS